MTDYLFVYGTLMTGFDNPFSRALSGKAELKGNGTIPGSLYLIDWYPGAIYQPDSDRQIHGEVFLLVSPSETIPLMDTYEEIEEEESKSLYLRRVVPVRMSTGKILSCWTYLYNQTVLDLPLIESGNFRTCRHITS